MCASITCKITVLIVNQLDFLISFHYSDFCNILTCYCLLSLLSPTLLPFVTDIHYCLLSHTLLLLVTYVIAFCHIHYCLCHRHTLLPFVTDIHYCLLSHTLLLFVTYAIAFCHRHTLYTIYIYMFAHWSVISLV